MAHDHTNAAVDIDDDLELLGEQIGILRKLDAGNAEFGEDQRYDFSIGWGTAMAGRLRRLVHYSSLGRLSDADERRYRELCDELRSLSAQIARFGLAQPNFTDSPQAAAKRFRLGRRRSETSSPAI